MREKISDGLTKQRRWQLKKKNLGYCQKCGKEKTQQSICEFCTKKLTNVIVYNKNIDLKNKRKHILEMIDILRRSKYQGIEVYQKVITDLKLNCSIATIKNYDTNR